MDDLRIVVVDEARGARNETHAGVGLEAELPSDPELPVLRGNPTFDARSDAASPPREESALSAASSPTTNARRASSLSNDAEWSSALTAMSYARESTWRDDLAPGGPVSVAADSGRGPISASAGLLCSDATGDSSGEFSGDASNTPNGKLNDQNWRKYSLLHSAASNDVLPRLPESVFNARIFATQFLLHLTLPFSLVALWACYPTWEAFALRCRNQFFAVPMTFSTLTAWLLFWSWGIPFVSWYTAVMALVYYARGDSIYAGWAPELAVTLIAVTLQRGMIAFKYSFLTDEEYDMYFRQPDMEIFVNWSLNFQLITGWILPSPGVVTQELQLAAQRQGLPLEDIFFTVDKPSGGGGSFDGTATWGDFFDFKGKAEGKRMASMARFMCKKSCPLEDLGTSSRLPCSLMCTQLLFRSTYDSPVYMKQKVMLEKFAVFASFMQCLIAPLWRYFVQGKDMYNWEDPHVLAFQIMQIPVLFNTLWACYMFLVVGALEYTRLAIMMRDLGAMVDTKFGYNPPPSMLLRKPPPRLDLYSYPSNIVSWCSTWLIIDDFGKLFNNRMQACSMFCCFGVILAAANSILIYSFKGGDALRSLLMPYQASVLGFWLAVVLLWTAFVGTDLNKQQVQIRNRLLKQQLLSRMDDDEKELLSVVVDTNLAHMSAKSAGSAKTQRRRKASTRGQGISESEMNRMQDLLVVSMELLEQDNVKRVAGMEATQELVSSVAFTVATLLWLSICILFFGADG